MIPAILLIYIGIKMAAPWWYFGLIVLWGLWEVFSAGVDDGGDDYDC